MSDARPILYVKTGCPWCHEAISYLQQHRIPYLEKNVSADPGAYQEMRRKSGQTSAPTLDWHGRILADFGVPELRAFLADVGAETSAGPSDTPLDRSG